jgi:hypothetical protein
LVGSVRERPPDSVTLIAAVTATLLTTACAGSRPPASLPAGNACALIASATTAESAAIVVTSPVDMRNAPRATTWGERFVFRLVRDTAPTLDCRRRPMTELAGPYRARDAGASTLMLEPAPDARGPRLTIHSATEASARDLVDAGVDLLLTDSPALAAYAATRSDVTSVPLGWDRTWVIAAPRGELSIDSSAAFRAGLARDAVRADARAAEGPYWWADTTGCGAPAGRSPLASTGTSRVVYPRDEPVGRALAERLVAVLGGRTTAAGLAPNAFQSALLAGGEMAYIIPLPRMTLDRCRAFNELLAGAPWLGARGTVTPLIDTRLRAVIRRDRLRLDFGWDSSVVILPARP